MRRPGWVTAAAIYNWAAGGLGVLAGIGVIVASAASMETDVMSRVLRMLGLVARESVLMGAVIAGIAYMLVSVLQIVCGYGIWRLHNWARITAVILHSVWALLLFITIVALLANQLAGSAVIQMFFFIVNVLFAVTLMMPGTAAAFTRPYTGSRPTFAQEGANMPGPARSTNDGPTVGSARPIPPTLAEGAVLAGSGGGFAPGMARGVAKTDLAESEPATMAWLVERNGTRAGREHRLKQQVSIGRDPTRCEIVLDDGKVSAEHARIRLEQGQFVIYDLASTNHTYINGQQIQKQALQDGDQIKLGPNALLSFMRVGK